jgi:hypothetical protein
VDFEATWKKVTAALVLAGVLAAAGARYLLTERTVETHTAEIGEVRASDTVQTQILDELKKAALSEQAAKDARNAVCRALRLSGKIERGECPPLEAEP